MSLLIRLIRKLFLIKEIISSIGIIHFQRYRLLSTPWFKIYLHKICQSDEEEHLHDHPWEYTSLLLKGSYKEFAAYSPHWAIIKERTFKAGQTVHHDHSDAHKLKLLSPHVWSLVLVSGQTYDWGFQTELGFMSHQKYRAWKRGQFNTVIRF